MPQIILRPNAPGDLTQCAPYPYNWANWQCVADVSPDDGASYVVSTDGYDLYNLSNLEITGTIRYIQVWIRCMGGSSYAGPGYANTFIKTLGNTYSGAGWYLGLYWAYYYTQYDTNPATGQAWTIAQINDLQAGVYLLGVAKSNLWSYCTQVYVLVDYVPRASNFGVIIG